MNTNPEYFFNNYIQNYASLNIITQKHRIDKYIVKNIMGYIFDDEIITEYYILKRIHKKLLTKETFMDWLSGTFYHYCMFKKQISRSYQYFYYGGKNMIKSLLFSDGNYIINKINYNTTQLWNELTSNKTKIELDENHKITSIRINCKDIKGEISDEISKLKNLKKITLYKLKNRKKFDSLIKKIPSNITLLNF